MGSSRGAAARTLHDAERLAAALGRCLGAAGDRRQLSAASGASSARERLRPRPRGSGALQVGARRWRSPRRLLAEQVLADLLALRGAQLARLARGEQRERGVRAVVHGALLDAEHRGDLGVALALAQQQREHRAQVGGELVQSLIGWSRDASAAAEYDACSASAELARLPRRVGYRGGAMAIPSAEQINEVLQGFDRLYGLELLEVLRRAGARPRAGAR